MTAYEELLRAVRALFAADNDERRGEALRRMEAHLTASEEVKRPLEEPAPEPEPEEPQLDLPDVPSVAVEVITGDPAELLAEGHRAWRHRKNDNVYVVIAQEGDRIVLRETRSYSVNVSMTLETFFWDYEPSSEEP